MAPPKRKTRRQQVYGERKKGRPGRRPSVAELAKKEKVITPIGVPTEPTTTTKRLRTISVTPRRGRRIPKGALPAGPREILIVTRKGQPQVFAKVEPLERKSYPPKSVSSSWLSTIGYFYNEKIGTFTTKTGRQYKIINFDFESFEEWFYAQSKGTYFNEFIKEQYTIRGTL